MMFAVSLIPMSMNIFCTSAKNGSRHEAFFLLFNSPRAVTHTHWNYNLLYWCRVERMIFHCCRSIGRHEFQLKLGLQKLLLENYRCCRQTVKRRHSPARKQFQIAARLGSVHGTHESSQNIIIRNWKSPSNVQITIRNITETYHVIDKTLVSHPFAVNVC